MTTQKPRGIQIRIFFRKIPGLEGDEYYTLQSIEDRLIDAAKTVLERRNASISLDEIAFTDHNYIRLSAQDVYHSAYSVQKYAGSDFILTLRAVIGGENLAHAPEKKHEFYSMENFADVLGIPEDYPAPELSAKKEFNADEHVIVDLSELTK